MDIVTALAKLYHRFGQEYRAGQVVFEEGEPGKDMYFVLGGSFEVVKKPADPKERAAVVLAKVGVEEFFGEMSLLLGEPRSATVRAAVDGSRVIRVSPSNFDLIVKLQPQIAIGMLKVLAQRMRGTSPRSVAPPAVDRPTPPVKPPAASGGGTPKVGS